MSSAARQPAEKGRVRSKGIHCYNAKPMLKCYRIGKYIRDKKYTSKVNLQNENIYGKKKGK